MKMEIEIEKKAVIKEKIEVHFPLYFTYHDSHHNGEWTRYIRIEHDHIYKIKESSAWGGNKEYEFETIKLGSYNRAKHIGHYITSDDYEECGPEVFAKVIDEMQLALLEFKRPATPKEVRREQTEAEKAELRRRELAEYCHKLIGKQLIVIRADPHGFHLEFPVKPQPFNMQTGLQIFTRYIGKDKPRIEDYIGRHITTHMEYEMNQTLKIIECERQALNEGQLWQVAASILGVTPASVITAVAKGETDGT